MFQVADNPITVAAVATAILAMTRLAFRVALLVFAAWLYRQSQDLSAIDKAAALAKAFSVPIARAPAARSSTESNTLSAPLE